jgi:hypothetical protein
LDVVWVVGCQEEDGGKGRIRVLGVSGVEGGWKEEGREGGRKAEDGDEVLGMDMIN